MEKEYLGRQSQLFFEQNFPNDHEANHKGFADYPKGTHFPSLAFLLYF